MLIFGCFPHKEERRKDREIEIARFLYLEDAGAGLVDDGDDGAAVMRQPRQRSHHVLRRERVKTRCGLVLRTVNRFVKICEVGGHKTQIPRFPLPLFTCGSLLYFFVYLLWGV